MMRKRAAKHGRSTVNSPICKLCDRKDVTAGIYEQDLPPHLVTVLSPADVVRGSPLQTDHQRTGPAR